MENKLKPQTNGVINTMQKCNIRTIMATGDNVLTAISVARQCKISNPKKEVFLADLEQIGDTKQVVWRSQPPAYRESKNNSRVEGSNRGSVVDNELSFNEAQN